MNAPSQKPPKGGHMQIQLPSNMEPTYANFALITHSHSEIVLDFAQIMPQVPRARVKARVVMTPTNAKLLLKALGEHLARFEARFGEISTPTEASLADQLFRRDFPPDEPEAE
jgi:hypothetical protein